VTESLVPAFVRVLIRDSQGRILIVAHRKSRHWNLPGGKLEQGETPDVAARREVFEETGVELKSLKLCHEDDFAVGKINWRGYFYEGEPLKELVQNKEPAKLSRVEFVDVELAKQKGSKAFLVDLIQKCIPDALDEIPWQMPLNLCLPGSFASFD
jgi:8-oxo-dGTP pyrophosphatase MutT (NUDIX family)